MGFDWKSSKGVESEASLRGGDATSEASKGVMIDAKSMADYRNEFESQRLQNRHATANLARILGVREIIPKETYLGIAEAGRQSRQLNIKKHKPR